MEVPEEEYLALAVEITRVNHEIRKALSKMESSRDELDRLIRGLVVDDRDKTRTEAAGPADV
jgi:hypothetical protein